jgi:hypothetical protein
MRELLILSVSASALVLLPATSPPVVAQGVLGQGITAQDGTSDADSLAVLSELRQEQARFERFRESRIPVTTRPGGGGCDARMGRICVWFGGEDEANFPPEPPETSMARAELIGALAEGAGRFRDPWIAGQLVHYLAEAGRLGEAESAARACDLEDSWWCSALLGYALHLQERFPEAEEAFRRAQDALPPEERESWASPGVLVTGGAWRELDRLDPEERGRRFDRFWRLSDPLFLVDGNDRWTEHMTRLVEVRNRENAENPHGLEWGDDMAESLIRYGRIVGYSRVRPPPSTSGGLGGLARDTRQMIGHHHPGSRGYIFPEEYLEAPADVPPESWITAPRAARAWYAPAYAPDLRALETQVASFRRGGGMLVVGAYRPAPPDLDHLASLPAAPDAPRDPFAPPPEETRPTPFDEIVTLRGPVLAGLFLVPEDGGETVSVESEEPTGVLTLRAPAGRWIGSLELLEPQGARAWRARQGITQVPLIPGLIAISDLLILRPDATYPESVEEAIEEARPGIRVGQGERFTVAWEVYGLDVQDELRVTFGFTRGRPGFLARVGEFLGVIEPDRPLEIAFEDRGPDEEEILFRALELEFPHLDPGEYTLHLRIDLPGREPVFSSRPIIVMPS